MTDLEQLIRDLDTLRQSIKQNSADLHQLPPAQLKAVLEHSAGCMTELEALMRQLNQLTASRP